MKKNTWVHKKNDIYFLTKIKKFDNHNLTTPILQNRVKNHGK